jgi:hypothetical protein
MGLKEYVILGFKVVLLILALLSIIFGFFADMINPQSQEMKYESIEDKTMPEEGYVTPTYDPWTFVRIEVEADESVEVQLYASHYRGGKLTTADNKTVLLDEWLAAGEPDERTGTSVTLKDFSKTSANYWVKVVDPGGYVPSDTGYTIRIKASTIDIPLIVVGLLLYGIFVLWGVMESNSMILNMLKGGLPARRDEAAGDLEALLEPAAPAPAPMAATELYGAPPPPPIPEPEPAPYAPPPPPAPEPVAYIPPVPEPAPVAPPYQPPPAPVAPAAPAYIPPPAPEAPPVVPPYQPPPAPAPAPVMPAAAPAAPAPAPAAAPPAAEPVSKVRCPACKSIVPIYTTDRPTPIECPVCGKKGMIR